MPVGHLPGHGHAVRGHGAPVLPDRRGADLHVPRPDLLRGGHGPYQRGGQGPGGQAGAGQGQAGAEPQAVLIKSE